MWLSSELSRHLVTSHSWQLRSIHHRGSELSSGNSSAYSIRRSNWKQALCEKLSNHFTNNKDTQRLWLRSRQQKAINPLCNQVLMTPLYQITLSTLNTDKTKDMIMDVRRTTDHQWIYSRAGKVHQVLGSVSEGRFELQWQHHSPH